MELSASGSLLSLAFFTGYSGLDSVGLRKVVGGRRTCTLTPNSVSYEADW